jgi:two-component system sensor histidine kinase YesM
MKAERNGLGMFAKLSIAFVTVCTLLAGGLLAWTVNSSMESLSEQKSRDLTLYLERTGQYLDLYLQNIRNILLGVSQSTGVLDAEEDGKKLELLLRENATLNNEIVSHLFVIYDNGTLISSNQILFEIIEHPHLAKIVQIAKKNPGLITWSEPYYSPMLVDRTVAFALYVQPVRDKEGYVLAAEIQTPRLRAQLSELLVEENQTLTLLSEQGSVITFERESSLVPSVLNSLPLAMEESFRQMLYNLPNGIERIQGTDNNHREILTVKSNRNKLGWYLVALSDDRFFQQGIQELRTRLMGVGLLCIVLLLVAALWISRQFTRPISRLASQMDRMDSERLIIFNQKLTERHDEVGQLTNSFYRMMSRIQELVETVKETEGRKKTLEMKLLLSQIRPHFLYNTLSCIGSLAKQNRVAEVEETIRSLITILSFSIDKKREMVLLEEELETLESYVQIQKVRYGNTFAYTADVPGEHRLYRLPKLLLQPLVENALFHGIVPKGEGTIAIRTECQDGVLHIYVEDNGCGFPDDVSGALDALEAPTEGDGGSGSGPGSAGPGAAESGRASGLPRRRSAKGLNSMGLVNVRDRIQLNYGPEYGLSIRSEPGQGTTVMIRIPASLV